MQSDKPGNQILCFKQSIYQSLLGSGMTICFSEKLCLTLLSFVNIDTAEVHL